MVYPKQSKQNDLPFITGDLLLLIRMNHGITEIAYASSRIGSKFRMALAEHQGIAWQYLCLALLGFDVESLMTQHPGSEAKYYRELLPVSFIHISVPIKFRVSSKLRVCLSNWLLTIHWSVQSFEKNY